MAVPSTAAPPCLGIKVTNQFRLFLSPQSPRSCSGLSLITQSYCMVISNSNQTNKSKTFLLQLQIKKQKEQLGRPGLFASLFAGQINSLLDVVPIRLKVFYIRLLPFSVPILPFLNAAPLSLQGISLPFSLVNKYPLHAKSKWGAW